MAVFSGEVEVIVAGEFTGIAASGLSVQVEGPDEEGDTRIDVKGELSGLASLPADAMLSCIINDDQGRVVSREDFYVDASSYIGFEVFEFSTYSRIEGSVGRIRLVMKAA